MERQASLLARLGYNWQPFLDSILGKALGVSLLHSSFGGCVCSIDLWEHSRHGVV